MITVPALGIEPTALRKRFEKCGFTAPVFTDEECDLAAKRQIDPVREGADVEGKPGLIDLLWQALDSAEKRRPRGSYRARHPPSCLHRSTMPRGAPAMPNVGAHPRRLRRPSDAGGVGCSTMLGCRSNSWFIETHCGPGAGQQL